MTMISPNPQFVVGLDRVGFAQIGAGLNSQSAALEFEGLTRLPLRRSMEETVIVLGMSPAS